MKKIIEICSVMISMILIFTCTTHATEGTNQSGSNASIIGKSAIVMDIETEEILFEKNKEAKRYPASITKIMTALVVLENRKLSDQVRFSKEALYSIEPGSSAAYIMPGERMTIEESLYVMMLHSANDVAHGLAYEVGGDLPGFAELMNQKAEKLGCENTHFVNASGLTDENHYTTASDMAKIAKAAYENKELRKIMSTSRYSLKPTNKTKESRVWVNGNRMIREGTAYYYEPCLGGKTGYTIAAGGTLVTFAEIKGRILTCVILKSQNSASAYEDSITLYEDLEENYDFSIFEKIKQEAQKKAEEKAEKEAMQKVFSVVKICVTVIGVLVLAVILRIAYVQNEKKKRRKNEDKKEGIL